MPTPSPHTACATASEPIRPGALAAPLLLAALALASACSARAAGQPEVAPQIRTIFQCLTQRQEDHLRPADPGVRPQGAEGAQPRWVAEADPPADADRARTEAKEGKDLEEKLKMAEERDAVRRDRNLMQRFPDEAAHRKAREKALDELRIAGRIYAGRIAELMIERKKLEEEKRFYRTKRSTSRCRPSSRRRSTRTMPCSKHSGRWPRPRSPRPTASMRSTTPSSCA